MQYLRQTVQIPEELHWLFLATQFWSPAGMNCSVPLRRLSPLQGKMTLGHSKWDPEVAIQTKLHFFVLLKLASLFSDKKIRFGCSTSVLTSIFAEQKVTRRLILQQIEIFFMSLQFQTETGYLVLFLFHMCFHFNYRCKEIKKKMR